MAARIPGVWGIDLGQCALKAIRLEMKDGEVVATAFEYIEHPKILSQPDADPDELSREALSQFLERNQIRGDLIAISVPGQSGLARFVKLPPVDEKKIADIVKFEAKQQIPFPLEEVVWDFQRLNKGDIIDGLALETEIGLFAMKRDMVTRAIAQFKDVGVEVHLVQMAPLALCNMIAYDLLGKEAGELADGESGGDCIVALEIGTDSSNLVITDGGRIIWQRPIPIGGNHFTRALTKEMKLTFAKAEHLKKNAAKSPDLKKILTALKQVLNDFVGEVQRSLGYFTNTHRNANIQYMVGLGNAFRLPGLQKFLQEKLQLEVRKFQKLHRTTGESVTTAPTFAENIMSFGVAYGLGLQGLKQAHLQTNLLPYEVRLERVIRGKKPWAVTAAASLLAGMCMLALAQGMEKRAVINEANKTEEKKLDAAIKDAGSNDAEGAEKKKGLEERLGLLDRIGKGAGDRINWQLLHQYINMSLPQPNGTRVREQAGLVKVKDELWNKNLAAQTAFRVFEQKKVGKLKDFPDADAKEINQFFRQNQIPVTLGNNEELHHTEAEHLDKFIKRNLIQINIAGINALYTDDLGPYFRKLQKDREALLGMAQPEKDLIADFVKVEEAEKRDQHPLFERKDKDGKSTFVKNGWVVEIRGSTFHRGGRKFVMDTILENLKNPMQMTDKEMATRIKDRVGFLHIYDFKEVKPGEPSTIAKSYLKVLIKGEEPAAGGGAAGGGGGGGGAGGQLGVVGGGAGGGNEKAGGGDDKNKRDAWNAIGEIAGTIFDGGAGGGPAAGNPKGFGVPGGGFGVPKGPVNQPGIDPKAGDKAAGNVVPRTEFVLLFVWREPIVAAPVAKKDDQP